MNCTVMVSNKRDTVHIYLTLNTSLSHMSLHIHEDEDISTAYFKLVAHLYYVKARGGHVLVTICVSQ